jgi:hypothetical protein
VGWRCLGLALLLGLLGLAVLVLVLVLAVLEDGARLGW